MAIKQGVCIILWCENKHRGQWKFYFHSIYGWKRVEIPKKGLLVSHCCKLIDEFDAKYICITNEIFNMKMKHKYKSCSQREISRGYWDVSGIFYTWKIYNKIRIECSQQMYSIFARLIRWHQICLLFYPLLVPFSLMAPTYPFLHYYRRYTDAVTIDKLFWFRPMPPPDHYWSLHL